MVAHSCLGSNYLTPDQGVACSIHVGFKSTTPRSGTKPHTFCKGAMPHGRSTNRAMEQEAESCRQNVKGLQCGEAARM